MIAGFDPGSCDGRFDAQTRAATEAFQRTAGLVVDGICGPDTWVELVEASFRRGDRLLYLQMPMLRGEDVADLQRQLGQLGFDAGRIDGVFGRDTSAAVIEFQRNVGLASDGICGPATIEALARYGGRLGDAPSVAAIREREHLRGQITSLRDCAIAIGDSGGLEAAAAALRRAVGADGSRVLVIHHPRAHAHAAQANRFAAHAYVGLEIVEHGPVELAWYEVPGYTSIGGQLLAGFARPRLWSVLGTEPVASGAKAPVLRATKMPAVVCRLPVGAVAPPRLPAFADAWRAALGEWTHHAPALAASER